MQALGRCQGLNPPRERETSVILVGIAVTVFGFVISLLSLGMASTVNVRLAMVLAGLVVSLFGIIGVINRAYLKNPIWKR